MSDYKRVTKPPEDCTEGHRLCHPRLAPGPSGVHFRHGADCPIHPLERIRHAQGRKWETITGTRGFRGNR